MSGPSALTKVIKSAIVSQSREFTSQRSEHMIEFTVKRKGATSGPRKFQGQVKKAGSNNMMEVAKPFGQEEVPKEIPVANKVEEKFWLTL
ncbi:unnamed protein product [Larinioides sclopetarius]|uniref:Uncharacterized protein n=2 Tax=Larinioides sclopetarius TaxID=280406 RepID=A0AAV2C0N2_9ARAC